MDSNGYLLSGYFIPYEVLTIILGHVLPHKSIIQCRMVCKIWRNIIEKESWRFVVKLKENQPELYADAEVKKISKTPWFILHAACAENSIFGRYFVMKKHCQDGPIWKLVNPDCPSWQNIPIDNANASTLENEPNEDLIALNIRLYEVNHRQFYKGNDSPIVELPSNGLSHFILKELRPKINISSWFCLKSSWDYDGHQCCPTFGLFASLRSSVSDDRSISSTFPRASNLEIGEWRKITATIQQPELRPDLNWVRISYQFFNCKAAEGMITRLLIHIERPNFFSVDWNSILNRDPNAENESFASTLISEYRLFLRAQIDSRESVYSWNLLPLHDYSFNLHAFPESGNLIPGYWYGRPLLDIIKATDNEVNSSYCREMGNYLLLFELRCRICLKSHGLCSFLLDDLKPCIEAYIDREKHPSFPFHSMKYEIIMSLLDNEGKILHQKKASEMLCEADVPRKLSLTFENYEKGVTYIEFSVQRHMRMGIPMYDDDGCPIMSDFERDVRNVINMCKVQVLLP